MSLNLNEVGSDSVGHCSICGHSAELFDLPGQTDKYCLECSADVATASLLITEIDAATLAGRNANALIAECTEITSRILTRAQSPELGF
jgi:hypothetical protein